MLKLNDLAADLACVAHQIGVPRNDARNMKLLVEKLAARDTRLPEAEQKGYARIYKEYQPAGYTRLFNLVDKSWPNEIVSPSHPVVVIETERYVHEMAWVLEFETDADPLVVGSRVNTMGAESGTRVLKMGTNLPAKEIELLIEQRADNATVHRMLRNMSGLIRCECRSALDFGMPFIKKSVLRQWYSDGIKGLANLHRAA